MKPITVFSVHDTTLKIWVDGQLVAEIPSQHFPRLIEELAKGLLEESRKR